MAENGALAGSTRARRTRPAADLPQPEGPRRTSIGYAPLGLSAESSQVRQRSQSEPLRWRAVRSRLRASVDSSVLGGGTGRLVAEVSKTRPRSPRVTR